MLCGYVTEQVKTNLLSNWGKEELTLQNWHYTYYIYIHIYLSVFKARWSQRGLFSSKHVTVCGRSAVCPFVTAISPSILARSLQQFHTIKKWHSIPWRVLGGTIRHIFVNFRQKVHVIITRDSPLLQIRTIFCSKRNRRPAFLTDIEVSSYI